MPSSFRSKSPLKVVTPFKYSIGLDNMVEAELMETVFTNIFKEREYTPYKLSAIFHLKITTI